MTKYETKMIRNGVVVQKYPGRLYAFLRSEEERLKPIRKRLRLEEASRFWEQVMLVVEDERISKMRDPMTETLSNMIDLNLIGLFIFMFLCFRNFCGVCFLLDIVGLFNE